MQRESQQQSKGRSLPKRIVKSTDLRQRLFEVGTAQSPRNKGQPSSPHRHPPKHLLTLQKDNSAQLLKYHPSNSPTLTKTKSKDFHIRKSPKFPFSPKSRELSQNTLSHFHKPDSVRVDQKELKEALYEARQQQFNPLLQSNSKLDEYVALILRGNQEVEEFLYLVRGKEENVYELELVNFEDVRIHEGEPNFEYYTVSKKGFCRYVGGKPQNFIEIIDWAQEKAVYLRIKVLQFFFRFRRWKTLQMWRRTVTRQRREQISANLQERLFLLDSLPRQALLQLRSITLDMEKAVLIIAKNEGTYSLESFKHCQQRARREASLAVEEFSRESRGVVRKFFQDKLSDLRENIKKNDSEQKQASPTTLGSQFPKEGAFQALGFPSNMSYSHRSKLRKETGRFLRFSYLVDNLHLSCLTGLYSAQVLSFITQLEQLQINEPVKLRVTLEQSKEEITSERIFALQLLCNFRQVPEKLVSENTSGDEFIPLRDIRLRDEKVAKTVWVQKISQYWLSLQPSLEEVLDQLTFLLKEGLTSLKCFERWSKHREMQKYVNVLEQWDDLVSEHWQISENDNLDPFLILDSLDPVLSRLKAVLKVTQSKLTDTLRTLFTELLNAYWQYESLNLSKLEDPRLVNPADTFDLFLNYTTSLLQNLTVGLPHRIELGIIVVHITKIKNILGQKFAEILQNLKTRLPQLVQQRTNVLNDWLSGFGNRLREEILNINDYVRTVGVIRLVEAEFEEKREECNELAQLYQTMQQFKMDTRRRKDFETVTLKLKDQLDQLLAAAEQNIERKTDLYSREVLKYHLPMLLKDITKVLEAAEQPKFLKFDISRESILSELQELQRKEKDLIEQRRQCFEYMTALKLQEQQIQALDELSRQISARVSLWKTLQNWEAFSVEVEGQTVKQIQISIMIDEVQEYRRVVKQLQASLPPNEVLNYLKDKIQDDYIYLPLLDGFSGALSEQHWNEVYEILPENFTLDLRKREFEVRQFLGSGVGNYSKAIQSIFEKGKVEAKLQAQYHHLEEQWTSLLAKIKTEGRFNVISNGQDLRCELDGVLRGLAQTLADPHAQTLKQYSITYQSLLWQQECLEKWLNIQGRMIQLERLCRLLDLKKIPDYSYFQNAERIYKQVSKATLIKGAEVGLKVSKLLHGVTEDKLAEISSSLDKIDQNITAILTERRKAYPPFYFFKDHELLVLITQPSHEAIESAAKKLLPGLLRLEFENERVMNLVTIDGQKLYKNPISLNSEVEQVFLQLTETMAQTHRRSMRGCRYKALQSNLTSMVQNHNIQHLLAISRVDFSQYTAISIDNQKESSDSVAQFLKVMRKDTAEDIRNRQFLKDCPPIESGGATIALKYDSLLLQQLLYEEVLNRLIKFNVERVQDFEWANQLRFQWEDTPGQQTNITVKQLHLALKYGGDFLGSQVKVIIQSDPELLLGLKLFQSTLYTGSSYALERTMHAVGYKTYPFHCSPLTSSQQLSQFTIGCYFSDYLPLFISSDLLSPALRVRLNPHEWISHFRLNVMKRSSPFIKDGERVFTLFSTLRQPHIQAHCLGQTWRVVEYRAPSLEVIGAGMQVLGLFSQQKNLFLLNIFQLLKILEERSQMQGISLEQFIDKTMKDDPNPQEHKLFMSLLDYLKPKVSFQTHVALSKHLEDLGLVNLDPPSYQPSILRNLSRPVLVLAGRGSSKLYFLEMELKNQFVPLVRIFGKSLSSSTIFSDQFSNYLLQKCPQEKCVIYVQDVTLELFQRLQIMVYQTSFFTQHPNISIVLDITQLDQFLDPRTLASFPLLNIEKSRKMIQSLIQEWNQKHLEGDRVKTGIKTMTDLVIPCLQTLGGKEELQLQFRFREFLRYLQSLLPVKNPHQACIYCLSLMYQGNDEDLLKLEYLTRKTLGEDYYSEDHRLGQLIYSSSAIKEGMITEINYLRSYIEERPFHNTSLIMTPELAHCLTAAKRIHQNTHYGVIAVGPGNSGKSTLLRAYRQRFHEDSFYLCIWGIQANLWSKKIDSVLQSHGLGFLGARINYKQTVLLIEDLHLAQQQKLTPLQLMLAYRRWQNEQNKEFSLLNVKLLMSSNRVPSLFSQSALKLKVGVQGQAFKGIFCSLFKQNSDPQWEIPIQTFTKIASSTYDICLKVLQELPGQINDTFRVMHRMVAGFSQLKIKDPNTVIKEIERFWSFTLQQSLKSYDTQGILNQQLQKADIEQRVGSLAFSHLISRSLGRRVQAVKDVKRLYNSLNQRIEKYNEGENKRYGQSFEFLNFDCLLQNIVSLSYSLLMQQDHMLVGRTGSNKQALVQLAAFLNGLHFRLITGPLPPVLLELADAYGPTPTLLLKKIQNLQDEKELEEYCWLDIEAQVLAKSQGKLRMGVREKKEGNPLKVTRRDQTASETYSMPRAKPSWEDVQNFKQSYRLVVTLTPRQEATSIPLFLRSRFHMDVMEEVPVVSLLQYNQKLLGVDGVTCDKMAEELMVKIYGHSRKDLGLSLRASDDSVRLFSSFLTNLVPEMKLQSDRYGKVLLLLDKLKTCSIAINASLCQCHARLKQLTLGESSKEDKIHIELELREKSTSLAISEKLAEILSWLEPSYKIRHQQYESLLKNSTQLELIFALTACYFVYLSNRPYTQRRQILEEWNCKIPLMQQVPKLKSFLPLFLLQEEEFNAQPVDDLPDFYQNMAIIFHSAKPVAIKDKCGRGKAWLQKNCSFVHIYENNKEFQQLIAENLSKPTNLLVEVNSQESLEALPNTTLGTLLFLPETVSTVSLGGDDVAVNPEAKVYLLLGDSLELPPRLLPEFTLVLYQQNEPMMEKALTHEYLSQRERQWHITGLDWLRKIRNLRLDCDNAMGQVAESIYQQLCGNEHPDSEELLLQNLSKITDKLMIRAQNQFTKIKEKEEMIVEFQEKADFAISKLHNQPVIEFHQMTMRIREILNFLISKDPCAKKYLPDYPSFFNTIKQALNRGLVNSPALLLLLSLRQWGSMLEPTFYFLFAFLLALAYKGHKIQDLTNSLTPQDLRSGSILTLIGRPSLPVLKSSTLEQEVARAISESISSETLDSLSSIFSSGPSNQPVLWLNNEDYPQRISLQVSGCSLSDFREMLGIYNIRLLEPTAEESLDSLIKKHLQENNIQVLCSSGYDREECLKTLRTWNFQEHATLIIQENMLPKGQSFFPFNIHNQQTIFKRIRQLYSEAQEICLMRPHHERVQELVQAPEQKPVALDPTFIFVESLVKQVCDVFNRYKLPGPLLCSQECELLIKSLENQENPLEGREKQQYLLKYLKNAFHTSSIELSNAINTIFSRVSKSYTHLKDTLPADPDEMLQATDLELGWLSSTRQLLGLPACQLSEKYLLILTNLINIYSQSKEEPTVERSSKRQPHFKQHRESIQKKTQQRESKKRDRRITVSKTQGSRPLAALILLRQSQHYQSLLGYIHQELEEVLGQLRLYKRQDWQTLKALQVLEKGQCLPRWNYLFVNSSSFGAPLDSVFQRLLARRNELFTLHSKMAVSDSCEVDFRHLRRPQDFLRAYFGSHLEGRDPFVLTTQLTEEEAESQDYLKVQGMWGIGWRLSSEGIIQNVGEGRMVQLGGCFIVRKLTLGIGFCGIEVGECVGDAGFMRVHCQVRKVVSGLKLYLKQK